MEPFTREQLQMKNAPELVENYKLADRYISEIYNAVVRASKHTTSYTHNLLQWRMEFNSVHIDRVVYRLRELFPGCIIEYIESKSAINGNIIERAVRIDWSNTSVGVKI
jgi:hypothetical protein